ncbi:tRNA splicing endonuclease subunit sen2, partial [Coemansia asiatica]
RVLWDNGSFGKGILSRSNPTWLQRYLQSNGCSDSTKQAVFPEDLTRLRRQRRTAAGTNNRQDGTLEPTDLQPEIVEYQQSVEMEPVQLSPCEALFLVYSGVLDPRDLATQLPVSFDDLWSVFSLADCSLNIKYAAYYYYRARGWAVRSGVKFGSDFLLYNRGPSFSHSIYSVVVRQRHQPDIQDQMPHGCSELDDSWQYLFALNRVSVQVKKTLVVCFVDPPVETEKISDPSQYTIEELVISRFNPNAK